MNFITILHKERPQGQGVKEFMLDTEAGIHQENMSMQCIPL